MATPYDAHADELVLASHRPARAQEVHRTETSHQPRGLPMVARWAFLVANDGDVLTIARGRHPHRPERPSPRTSGDPPAGAGVLAHLKPLMTAHTQHPPISTTASRPHHEEF